MSTSELLAFEDEGLFRSAVQPNLALAAKKGAEAKKKHGLMSAMKRKEMYDGGLAAILIDYNMDFCEGGRLAVSGFKDDLWRALKRYVQAALTNENGLAHLLISIDNHPPHTIHSQSWYEDEHGNIPIIDDYGPGFLVPTGDSKMPFEAFFVVPEEKKLLVPRSMKNYTVNKYAPHIQNTGQGNGNIWVFPHHCQMGSDGVNLHPALSEFAMWVSIALDLQVQFIFKGHVPMTDWFGIFAPCIEVANHPQGGKNVAAFDTVRKAKDVEVCGEAEDFCVASSMNQTLDEFAGSPDVLSKIRFIEDCTSPIVADNPDKGVTHNADFRAKMAKAGIQLIKHDAPLAS